MYIPDDELLVVSCWFSFAFNFSVITVYLSFNANISPILKIKNNNNDNNKI